MSVELSTISHWLNEGDTEHYYDEDREVIVFGATRPDTDYLIDKKGIFIF